ncbi:MAG: NADH-quinone oxidoreductase subunit L [Candidatus Comchoanobacterales bacterium]
MQALVAPIAFLCLCSPLIGAVSAMILGKDMGNKGVHIITIMGIAIAWVLSLLLFKIMFFDLASNSSVSFIWWHWLSIGQIDWTLGGTIDRLAVIMMVVVLSVSLMVHIYSIGYMAGDPHQPRFFGLVSMFTFAMLLLVYANNFLQLFMGWEGVGVVSYLLIGFWRHKQDAANGSFKAFIVNRVGDLGLIVGVMLTMTYASNLSYSAILTTDTLTSLSQTSLSLGPLGSVSVVEAIAFCLFIGAMGKSAQIPLHVWLPESMAGPTPISALIHAATMVTAGVYLVVRLAPLYDLAEVTRSIILILSASGALWLGLAGCVKKDIKQVVAYSTLSQLGYMMAATAASAYSLAMFHLVTHAFFKSLLFLGAGAVIVGMGHEQRIDRMGGLFRAMPVVAICFLIGSLALMALPPLAGFFSKDGIIEVVKISQLWGSSYAYWCLYIGAGVTAFYSIRLYYCVFHGPKKTDLKHAVGPTLWMPLVLLSIPSMIIGYYLAPWIAQDFLNIQSGSYAQSISAVYHHLQHPMDMMLSIWAHLDAPIYLVSIVTLMTWSMYHFGWYRLFVRPLRWLSIVLENNYFIDALYLKTWVPLMRGLSWVCYRLGDQMIIEKGLIGSFVGVIRWSYQRFAYLQSGRVTHYVLWMFIGLMSILISAILWLGV